MIKAVLFDFGGVLTESGKSGFVNETVAQLYGQDPAGFDIGNWHYRLRRGQIDIDSLFTELNAKYGKQVTKEMFVELADADLKRSNQVYDLAAKLRAMGIRTGILSNIFSVNAHSLRQKGFYNGFDPIVLSCDEGCAKPDKELYDKAIDQLGIDPHEILFIDDQDKCIGPAEAMGMYTVKAESPDQIVSDTLQIIRTVNGGDIA